MGVKVFVTARERLLEVWHYTERTWGEEQADRYVQGMVSEIIQIQTARYRWRPVVSKGLKGIYFFRYQHHFIFFRELSGGSLGVISILHENMDIPSRLKEDSTKQLEA